RGQEVGPPLHRPPRTHRRRLEGGRPPSARPGRQAAVRRRQAARTRARRGLRGRGRHRVRGRGHGGVAGRRLRPPQAPGYSLNPPSADAWTLMARLSLAVMLLAAVIAIAPAGQAAAATSDGLPDHFGIGVSALPDGTGLYGWMPDTGIPWDYAYQYLA